MPESAGATTKQTPALDAAGVVNRQDAGATSSAGRSETIAVQRRRPAGGFEPRGQLTLASLYECFERVRRWAAALIERMDRHEAVAESDSDLAVELAGRIGAAKEGE